MIITDECTGTQTRNQDTGKCENSKKTQNNGAQVEITALGIVDLFKKCVLTVIKNWFSFRESTITSFKQY